MDADGWRRLGRHFGEEVPSEPPVGLVPAGDSASYPRPSASIRGFGYLALFRGTQDRQTDVEVKQRAEQSRPMPGPENDAVFSSWQG